MDDSPDPSFTWLDGQRLKVYELARGTKRMPISATSWEDAFHIAKDRGFNAPFDRLAVRSWFDHLARRSAERKCVGR